MERVPVHYTADCGIFFGCCDLYTVCTTIVLRGSHMDVNSKVFDTLFLSLIPSSDHNFAMALH